MLKSFIGNRRGNIAVGAAVLSVPLLAAVAGAVDVYSLERKASHLQSGLDAAALAVAREYTPTKTEAELKLTAKQFFESNMTSWRGSQLPEFSYAANVDSSGKLTVELVSSFAHQGFIGWDFWKSTRRTVVSLAPKQFGCILALHPTASGAVKFGGSTNLNLKNCLVAANSNASSAVSRSGAATLRAECVAAVGQTSGLNQRTTLDCPALLEGQPPAPDPLASVEPPSYTGCRTVPLINPKQLDPGTYCNQTWTGNISLSPGSYILRGGAINLGGGGSITGVGVTIFLMDGAVLTSSGNEVFDLAPPENGPYAGISIFQDRNNANAMTLTGGSGTKVTGFVYAPAASLLYKGNSSMTGTGECIRIVASTIELSGNSSIELDCGTKLGGRKIRVGPQSPILVH